jgi:hypothetical protein
MKATLNFNDGSFMLLLLLLLLLLLVLLITFVQGIYNNVPETNHVYTVHNFRAALRLQLRYMARVMLYPIWHV